MKKQKTVISAIVIALTLTVFLSAASAMSFKSFNGHTYVVVKEAGLTWDGATTHMQDNLADKYHLATITSQEEQDFVQSELLGKYSGEFWLGGYQLDGTMDAGANWNWVTGETWGYDNWQKGEPNDYYGKGSEQHLAMWSNFDWKWNDEGNNRNIAGYIAETAPVPEPGTLLLLGSGLAGLALYRRKKAAK